MNTQHFLRFVLSRWLPLLLLAFGAAVASAQQEADPPARVASLSQIDGSVAFAPAGETEWADAVLNRPITRGDRLWTDRGARAELHLGSAVLHVDSQTFLDLTDLDDDVLQASLNEGTVNARVRDPKSSPLSCAAPRLRRSMRPARLPLRLGEHLRDILTIAASRSLTRRRAPAQRRSIRPERRSLRGRRRAVPAAARWCAHIRSLQSAPRACPCRARANPRPSRATCSSPSSR